MTRKANIQRETTETRIDLSLDLDIDRRSERSSDTINTGVGFLNHMLELFARHGSFAINVQCDGDTHIDDHHTAEDIGICLGQAFKQALGDKRGILRYGHFTLPMDETLVTTAVDFSGRSAIVWNADFPTEKIGSFDTQLVHEFWNAFTGNAQLNLHVLLHYGTNSHHIAEAIFKSLARSIRMAIEIDPNNSDRIPSTKETLS